MEDCLNIPKPRNQKKNFKRKKEIVQKKGINDTQKNKKKRLKTDANNFKGNDESDFENEIYENTDDCDSDNSKLYLEVDSFIKKFNFDQFRESNFAFDEKQKISDKALTPKIKLDDKSKSSAVDLKDKKKRKFKITENKIKNLDKTLSFRDQPNKSNLQKNSKFDILELKAVLNSDEDVKLWLQGSEKNKNRRVVNVLRHDDMRNTEDSLQKNKLVKDKNNLRKKSNIQEKIPVPNAEEMASVFHPEASQKRDSLKEKLKKQLQSASFRIINEQLYTSSGSDAYKKFHDDPDTFKIYHEGYNNQVSQWPISPLSVIASWLRKKPKNWVIADFGCGDATLAKSIHQKVYSIDLVASGPSVIECDMAHTPFKSNSVDVVVFCLSLMGTNLKEFILEANRVLVQRGVLKIAEVESRFENVTEFLKVMLKLGFRCICNNQEHDYFRLFDFLKVKDVKLKANTPEVKLKPCMYKKR